MEPSPWVNVVDSVSELKNVRLSMTLWVVVAFSDGLPDWYSSESVN